MNLNNIRLKPRLILLFILIGVVTLGIAGFISYHNINRALLEKSMDQLETIQELRSSSIIENMERQINDLSMLSKTADLENLFDRLLEYRDSQNMHYYENFPTNTDEYRTISENANTFFTQYVNNYGYDDLYLIENKYGYIMYSCSKNSDLGVNLNSGTLNGSGLSEVWKKVVKTEAASFSDYDYYQPAGEQSAFLGQPIFNNTGDLSGVLILRLDSDLINNILDSRTGMGKTGESYLISWIAERSRFEFRSNMSTMGDGNYVIGAILNDPPQYWHDAQKSECGKGEGIYTDSIGEEVLIDFTSIHLGELDWILISKIDTKEVLSPLITLFLQMGGGAVVLLIVLLVFSLLIADSITKPVEQAVNFADTIAHENFERFLDFNQKDEMGDLARSLNEMARDLKKKKWMKDGRQGLDDALRGEHTLQEIAEIFINYMVLHMNGELGAIYLMEDNELQLTASHAFSDRKGNFNRFKQGEGMIGQTALEKKTVYFTDMGNQNAPDFNFGIGTSTPPFILTAPLLLEEEVIGVFLIGSFTPFTDRHRSFIEQNTENIAIQFNSAKSRTTIRELLEEAQDQREELRVTNEELEQQTQALKASEEELQAQQEELRVTNEELQERTEALEKQSRAIQKQNSDLHKARTEIEKKAKDLEIASKYKSEFLANMSHELRTPLNSILILSQLISKNKDKNLSEKQISSAEAIHSSGSDLLKLINEILDLSKVESGKLELHIEEMKMDGLISDLERVFRDLANSKDIDFSIEIEKDTPQQMQTDSHRLQQILRNLLTNAFKFTPEGKVTLKIGKPSTEQLIACSLQESNAIAFSVIDNGTGIPENKQAVIFEAFQQADGSTSRKYGGTGLGLSISRELTKRLGGQIFLKSQVGEGSNFTIVIPRALSLQENIGLTESEEIKNDNKKTISGKTEKTTMEEPQKTSVLSTEDIKDDRNNLNPEDKTLLIIEDDPTFVEVLKSLATELGYKVLLAEDGETGLHFADYYRPSAIILDIGLPGIDGWSVMERLKGNPELRHIPVHFMSGFENSLPAMKMGAVGFLTKPVSLEKLKSAFDKIEHILTSSIHRILIVEDDEIQRNSIEELVGSDDIETQSVGTGNDACVLLKKEHFDCMILDLGLHDMSGYELLEKIWNDPDCQELPVIIYTGRDLTQEEETRLKKYTEKIIIKGVKSPERLLDETALFLHRVEKKLPKEQKEMLKRVHPSEQILSDKKILLVDDDMRNVFALSNVLEEKNLKISVARDGVECLETLESGYKPDLILMDIMMPRKDGYETMRDIRKKSGFKKLPIIALTAKAMKGDRNKCIEAGASDYLAKPVDTEKLLSMMRVWLY